jgi:hypothetical protein
MVTVWHPQPEREKATDRRGYGPLGYCRFDPHQPDRAGKPRIDPSGRSAIYLARELGTALAEVYGDVPSMIDICPRERAAVVAPAGRALLGDLTGPGLMRVGAYVSLSAAAGPRRLSQEWARAIHDDQPWVCGLHYLSAHDNGECVVLWERAPPLDLVGRAGLVLDLKLQHPALWPTVRARLAERGRSVRAVESCPRCLDNDAAAKQALQDAKDALARLI